MVTAAINILIVYRGNGSRVYNMGCMVVVQWFGIIQQGSPRENQKRDEVTEWQ